MILAMGFLNPEETIPKALGLAVDQVSAVQGTTTRRRGYRQEFVMCAPLQGSERWAMGGWSIYRL